MNYSNSAFLTPRLARIFSVWYRHFRVYFSNIFSNAFTPFMEPLVYLAGLGIGVGAFIDSMDGVKYTTFLASGMIITSAMYSSAFECTYGTFIRLEFEKVYDGMLGAPISTTDLILGELLFVGTKGFFFSLAVLMIVVGMGIITYPLCILGTIIGFVTGVMFGVLSMMVTSFVKNINYFNFYFSGFLAPSFFFSGVVFPLKNLPQVVRYITEILPLTHLVRLVRACSIPGRLSVDLWWDILYCIVFTLIIGGIAMKKLEKRLIV